MRPRQRGDLQEVRAGARVQRDRPERQRVQALGARRVGGGRGRARHDLQLRRQVVARRLGLGIGAARRLHEPDELARAQPEREPPLPRGRQRHHAPRRQRPVDRSRPRPRRRRRRPPSMSSAAMSPRISAGRVAVRSIARTSTPASARISPTNCDAFFAAAGPPCVVRMSRSCARVIATYSSRRSSSVWMSPAGTASRSSSRGNRPSPCCANRPLPFEQPRNDDDRELQALRLVQGHEPDAIDVLGELHARRQLAARALVRVQVRDEAAQRALRVGGLPVRGEAQEARDVGDGPLRPRACPRRSGPARGRSARGTAPGSCAAPRGT